MDGYDEEVERLRAAVSCATVLERMVPGWRLDRAESTRRALKYRGGPGEIVIVNHDGQGWWDPHKLPAEAGGRGDVFSLVQRLDPALNFGQVRKVLRGLVGIAPTYPAFRPPRRSERDTEPPVRRWEARRRLRCGSPTWRYLTQERCLPTSVLAIAVPADAVREGPYGSAWFAHRANDGRLTGIEMRGPHYRGFSPNGSKTLFRLPGSHGVVTRLVVAEAPINAMSFAALERIRTDTLYAATAGGMGPDTIETLVELLSELAGRACARLVIATDADKAGDRYAVQLGEMASEAGVPTERVLPLGRAERLERCAKGSGGQGDAMIPTRAWVRLASGRRVNLLDPHPDAWTEADLAIGLSRTYRWGGHSIWHLPLSVAQYSLLVLTLRERMRGARLAKLEGLREVLHDAFKGLLSFDPIAPVTPHLGTSFTQLVCRLQAAIAVRYGLQPWSGDDYTAHKHADRLAAASEALHVAGWSRDEIRDTLRIADWPLIEDPLPVPEGMTPWEPRPAPLAASLFLAKLRELLADEPSPHTPGDLTAIGRYGALPPPFPGCPSALGASARRHQSGPGCTTPTSTPRPTTGRNPSRASSSSASATRPAPGSSRNRSRSSRPTRSCSSARDTIAMSKSSEVSAGDGAGVMAGLTQEQSLAATTDGPVLVIAGAGTGKTRTLTAAVARRILVSGIKPTRILAVTFTNKAAAEMSSRIRAPLDGIAPPSWVGTFHGLGARQLRAEPEVADLRPGFEILDSDDTRRLVRRTMKAMSLANNTEGPTGRNPVKVMCNRLSKFKDSLIVPEESATRVEGMIAAAGRSGLRIDAHGLREAAQVYVEYQRRLRDGNAADFGDLLLWPTRAMQGSETYRQRWAERFDCVLADEYQDVCYAQYCWLRLLAADHNQLFVVGDDDQAIYSFRGSDLGFIRRFTVDFPSATQIRLEENFRLTGHILDAANAVIAKDTERLG
jgi:hypothetical protein